MRTTFILLAFIMYCSAIIAQQVPIRESLYVHECAVQHGTVIHTAPPIEWNMPLEVHQTYFAIDSLCRSLLVTGGYDAVSVLADQMLSEVDYDSLFKYIYSATEYDSYLFYSYLHIGSHINQEYNISPATFLEIVRERAEAGKCNRLNSMLALSGAIVTIEVIRAYDSIAYHSPSKTSPQKVTCIEGRVITCIKGDEYIKTQYDPETGGTIQTIKFSYTDEWMTGPVKMMDDVSVLVSADSVLQPPSESRTYGMQIAPSVGEEYFVVLYPYMENHADSYGMPYNLFPYWGLYSEGGLHEISATGYIRDEQNFYGFGVSVSIASFLSQLQSYITATFSVNN